MRLLSVLDGNVPFEILTTDSARSDSRLTRSSDEIRILKAGAEHVLQ